MESLDPQAAPYVDPYTQPAPPAPPVSPQEPAQAPPVPAPDPEPVAPDPEPVAPVSDPGFEYAREGQFVDVVAGEHAGLFGVYLQTVERDENDVPVQVIVRNRDHGKDVDLAIVNFSDIRPSARTGGR